MTYSHTQLLTLDLGSGSLDLGGSTQTVGGITLLSGNIVHGTLASAARVLHNGDIHSILIGTGDLSKIGTGTVTLFAANRYVGNATVSAGTLVLANSEALPAAGILSISGDGAVVFGDGLGQAIELGGLSIDTGIGGPISSLAVNEGSLVSTSNGSIDAPTGSVRQTPTSVMNVSGDRTVSWPDRLVVNQQSQAAAAIDALLGAVVPSNGQEDAEPVPVLLQPAPAASATTTLTGTAPADLSLIAADVWRWRSRIEELEQPPGTAPWASLMPYFL